MRIIKFRAWDPETRHMLDEWILNTDYSYSIPGTTIELQQLTQIHGLDIMQFSGFYDRTGREIYEGDILLSQELDTGLEDELFEMVFEWGGFCLTEFPRRQGSVFYRNWYHTVARNSQDQETLPQPSCMFQVVGHRHEPLERIEQRLMALHQAQKDQSSLHWTLTTLKTGADYVESNKGALWFEDESELWPETEE